jgi:hypothetical protein
VSLTAERLCELLAYNQETGEFHWRYVRGKGRRPGKLAGSRRRDCYMRIVIDGRRYYAQRLAWFYMTGAWPVAHVDHKDGDPSNNRWDNLREATHAQNIANQRKHKDNPYGVKGVYLMKRSGKKPWVARINKGGKNKYLGYYSTKEEAHAAYCRAAVEKFGEFARFE